MQKNYIYRGGFYLVGLLVLALGISLNTKTGLGVSPIISVSYSISTIWDLNFGNMTMVLYCIFVLVEMLLHTILCRKELKREDIALEHANEMNLKLVLIMDLLQIPLSLVFTRFLNVFGAWIPDLKTDCANSFSGTFAGRVFFLIIAIILTGVGAAMSLNMRVIPNPGRRYRTSDFRYHSQKHWIYKELLRSVQHLRDHQRRTDLRPPSGRHWTWNRPCCHRCRTRDCCI